MARISLPETPYDEPAERAAFIDDVVERTAALPGIQNASAIYTVPMAGGSSWAYQEPSEVGRALQPVVRLGVG